MNRRLNGFIKKPHIFVDKNGRWVCNISTSTRFTDDYAAELFCDRKNKKGK